MNEEQKINVKANGNFNNMDLKELKNGNYLFVEKVFNEGRELLSTKYKDKNGQPIKSYSCRVRYDDQEVSFFLTEAQHEIYKVLGNVGSKIKITSKLDEISVFDGKKNIVKPVRLLEFEAV